MPQLQLQQQQGQWKEGEGGNVGENCETDFSQFHFVLAVETVINLMKECVVHTFYLTRDEDDFRHLKMREVGRVRHGAGPAQ